MENAHKTSSPTVRSHLGPLVIVVKLLFLAISFRGRGMNTLTIKLILPSLIDNSLDNAFNKLISHTR